MKYKSEKKKEMKAAEKAQKEAEKAKKELDKKLLNSQNTPNPPDEKSE